MKRKNKCTKRKEEKVQEARDTEERREGAGEKV
jgi:hypothetical protein